jgi:hypothetical protein
MDAATFKQKMSDLVSGERLAAINKAIAAGIIVGDYPPAPTHDGRRGFFIPYEAAFPTVDALRKMGYEVVVCPRTGRHIAMPLTPDERRLCEKDESVNLDTIDTLRAILDQKDAVVEALKAVDITSQMFRKIYEMGRVKNPKELLAFLTHSLPSHIPIDLVEAAQTCVAKLNVVGGDGSLDDFRRTFCSLMENSIFEIHEGGVSVALHRLCVPAMATAEFDVEQIDRDSPFLRVTYR